MACVLVSDINHMLTPLFQEMLEETGHEALVASEKTHAIELIQNHRIELLCIDLDYPEPVGLSWISTLRETAPGLKILVTCHSKNLCDTQGMERSHCLVKPFSMNEFSAAISALLCE